MKEGEHIFSVCFSFGVFSVLFSRNHVDKREITERGLKRADISLGLRAPPYTVGLETQRRYGRVSHGLGNVYVNKDGSSSP